VKLTMPKPMLPKSRDAAAATLVFDCHDVHHRHVAGAQARVGHPGAVDGQPAVGWGLMLGKLTPYLCISMMMAVGLIGIMQWVFNVPIAGDFKALFVATLLYVFALLSLGLLISTWAQNQIQALQMCVISILPSVFFSGFIFPRETMPWILDALGAVLPATYYIELQRAIVLRGASLGDFWVNIVILAGMGLAVISLCALQFKRKIA
jgi:ABC-2 type transport system permease protein